MHVTTKDVVQNEEHAAELGLPVGTHLLESTLEADGANELASAKASFSGKVLSIERTASGGITVKVAVSVNEPKPVEVKIEEPVKQPTREELALAFFTGKGFKAAEAKANVEKFGVDRVLAMREQELDEALAATLEKK